MLHEYLDPDEVAGTSGPSGAARSKPVAPTTGEQTPPPAESTALRQVAGTVQQNAPFSVNVPVYVVVPQNTPAPACPFTPTAAAETSAARTPVPAAAPGKKAAKSKAPTPAPRLAAGTTKVVDNDTGGEIHPGAALLLLALTVVILVFTAAMTLREADTTTLIQVGGTGTGIVVVLAAVVFRKRIGRRWRTTRKVAGVVADVTIASAQIVKDAMNDEEDAEHAGHGDHPEPAAPA